MTNEQSNTGEHGSVWQRGVAFLRESLQDNDNEYTSGRIKRALGLLAIPMMLEMSMESVFAVVDIAFRCSTRSQSAWAWALPQWWRDESARRNVKLLRA
jgi:hypothetical protein